MAASNPNPNAADSPPAAACNPPVKIPKNPSSWIAFLVGGLLCAIGQVLIDYTKLTPARILTGYVVAGVLLSAVGLYPKLIDWAGGGASVPLTGFGNLLAQGVRDAIQEDGFLGI